MLALPSEQSIRIPHQPIMEFYDRVKEIKLLYPKLRLIQDKIDEENTQFSCTIIITEPLLLADEEEVKGDILSLIKKIILPALPQGFRSTSGDITFVVQENVQSEISDFSPKVIGEICRQVEFEFKREEIQVEYQPGRVEVEFIVSGAEPRIHNAISAAIIARLPHTLQCRMKSIQFQSHFDAKKRTDSTHSRQTMLRIRDLLEGIFGETIHH